MKILDLLSNEEACSRFFRDVRAVKRLMLSFREETQSVKMDRTIEVDEVYVAAGLKGRNNSSRIKSVGRKLRRRSFKRRGRGG